MKLSRHEFIACDDVRLRRIRSLLMHYIGVINNILEQRQEKTGLRRFKEIDEVFYDQTP